MSTIGPARGPGWVKLPIAYAAEKWAIVPTRRPAGTLSFCCMTKATRSRASRPKARQPGALPLVEEGAAFAELEGEIVRARIRNQQERPIMTQISEERSREEQAAPMEAWDAIAADYDRFVTPNERELATDALRSAGLQAGDRFLDVAAGTGGLSFPAARLGALITATDWAPNMIERFQARVRDLGLRDAEGYVMDCRALDLPDDTFDVTGSMFGVMLVPNQKKALREMVRVTKPDGRVLLIAFGDPGEFEALQFFLAAIRAVLPDFQGLPDDPPPLEFQVSDPEEMRRRLVDAGLKDVSIDCEQQERIEVRSGQELWNWCLGSNPIPGMLVADLTDDQRAAVRRKLDEMIAERADDQGAAILTAALNIGVGRK